jgi:hypothetical protein
MARSAMPGSGRELAGETMVCTAKSNDAVCPANSRTGAKLLSGAKVHLGEKNHSLRSWLEKAH